MKQIDSTSEDIGSEEYHKKQIFRGIATILGVDFNVLSTDKPLIEYLIIPNVSS